MERNNRGNFWAILSTVLAAGLLTLLCFSTQTEAQWGKKSVYKIFTEGAEDYHKKEYEKAKLCFDEVKTRITELKPEHHPDLVKWIEFNNLALAGRKKYGEILDKAEAALKQKQIDAVNQCLKELNANPYPSKAQLERRRALECEMNGCTLPNDHRALLKSAHIAFDRGDLDTAEWLCRKAIEVRPIFPVWPTFDTPEKLLDRIQEERDPRAGRVRPGLLKSINDKIWGTSTPEPPKDQKPTPLPIPPITNFDGSVGPKLPPMEPNMPPPGSIQPQPLPPGPTEPMPLGPSQPPSPPPPASSQPLPLPIPPPPPSSDNRTGPSGTTAVRMSDRPLPPASDPDIRQVAATNEDAATVERRRQAVGYLRDALRALELNDLAEARRRVKLAADLHVALLPADPNPNQILDEINRREAAAGGKMPDQTKTPAVAPRPQDARALIRQAREYLKKERFDEAEKYLALASEARPKGWGLFEDSPDKVQRDLIKMRTQRDRERAVKIMKDARKAFNEGSRSEAKKLAYEAKALHGPYNLIENIWDENPQNLINEIERLEQRERKAQDETKIAQKQDPRSDDPAAAGPIPAVQDGKRKQVQALLSEAGALRAKGTKADLVKARTILFQANALGATFEPGEPTPASVMSALNAQCNNILNQDLQAAVSLANAVADPARFQKALALLNEARDFCTIFQQDPQPIDQQIAQVMLVQGQSPPPPRAYTAIQKEGLAKLKQARVELEMGNLAVARRLAEAAFDRKYDIQEEAGYMLRTLDAADRQRYIETVNLNARSGIDAFQHKQYQKAAQIFKAVDMQFLDAKILSQVREIMATKEMQPSNLAQDPGDLPPANAPEKGGFATIQPKNSGQTGRASVGDGAMSDLASVRAIEKIQFSYWRDRSIGVQQTAIEICKTDPDLAIAQLQGFLEELRKTSFNQTDQDALIRPIEIRINQYNTIKAQRLWEKQQADAAKERPLSGYSQEKELERNAARYETEKEVAKRIKNAGILMKQSKYEEALQEYEICNKLLPGVGAAIIGMNQAKTKIVEANWNKNKLVNERYFTDALSNDLVVHPVNQRNPLIAPAGFGLKPRQDTTYSGVAKSPTERMIEAKLREPTSVNFRDTELKEAIFTLATLTGLNIVPDLSALREEGVSLSSRVTIHLEGVALKSVLNLLLKQLHLTYVVKDDVLQITTERGSEGNLVQKVYSIADLVVPIPDYPTSTFDDLHKAFARHVAGSTGYLSNQYSLGTPNNGIPPGVPVSKGYNGSGNQNQVAGFGGSDGPAGPVLAEQLQGLITDCVGQNTWQSTGGRGNIRFFPLGNALIVNQSEAVHEAIASLLANLRKMQEVQVAIDMRVITLSDQFFDFVNMNFEIGNTAAFATGPGKIAAMAPAGTTPSLSMPFRNVAQTFATPPAFGGVLLGSSGVAVGVNGSILNEIQVQMFLDVARGDKRTQDLGNPNITVLNGQTAHLTVNKTKFYTTSAMPVQNGAQVMFVPQNNPFPIGISMQVTPIVSADRRFVRLHLVPDITNLVSNNVPAIPMEIPVQSIYEGRAGNPGPPSILKIWFQQPEFEHISLNTAVNVPDGGTVLLGGLKTTAEVRNDNGPPVLSQLPLINRLFRNTNYTRDSRSLMIMVTPRIIINEAEYDYPQPGPMTPTVYNR